MSVNLTYTCDLCGQPVDHDDVALITAEHEHRRQHWDLHPDCLQRIKQTALELADPGAARLEAIPVATQAEIDRRRPRWQSFRDFVWSLDLPSRAHNAVMKSITSLHQLEAMRDDELLAIRGIGPVAVRRLREGLATHPTKEHA